MAIVGATLFSFGLRSAAFLPPPLDVTTTQQIAQRISPGLLSVVVGVCAGGAGAFGLATDVPVSLVGVMIAAALIPAAAAVGIGVAWGVPGIALGAFLLLVLNAAAIHVAGASVLRYLGYRPDRRTEATRRSTLSRRQAAGFAAVLVVLGAVVVGAGGLVASHVAFERDANRVASDVLAEDRYADLELVSVRAAFEGEPPFSVTERKEVTVVVGRPADRNFPVLARTIGERLEADTSRDVTVVLEFVEHRTYDSGAGTQRRRVAPSTAGESGDGNGDARPTVPPGARRPARPRTVLTARPEPAT
ncbi:MAG: DUF389 domain-containing protein [Haloferacaceae archaeon]